MAQASRWLDAEDRHLLALWWLEAAGELDRSELAAAMESDPAQVAVLVHRTKARLETARTVVRAVQAAPRCRDLEAVCATWDGLPSPLWRKRIARHVRECPSCGALQFDMVPAEGLLVGLGLVPVPLFLQSAPYLHALVGAGAGAGAGAAGTASAIGATHAAGAVHVVKGAGRIVAGHRAVGRHLLAGKAVVAVVAVAAVMTVIAGVFPVKSAC